MKKLAIKLLGVVIVSVIGDFARVRVRRLRSESPSQRMGECVWGGQNQDWCLRRTGHRATRMPNGTLRCYRQTLALADALDALDLDAERIPA
jgi:hypothetical protein